MPRAFARAGANRLTCGDTVRGINGIHTSIRLTIARIIDEARRGNKSRWADERLAACVHRTASFASAASYAIGEQLIFGELLRILQIFESVDFPSLVVANSPLACKYGLSFLI